MEAESLLLAARSVRTVAIRITPEGLMPIVEPITRAATCPFCGRPSSRVHSRYARTLQDLPVQGRIVQLQLRLRRFFCEASGCPRVTFAERLPDIAQPHARKTPGLQATLTQIAFAVGGEGGSRLAGQLGMPGSGDTLLRLVRRTCVPTSPAGPQVLGVDDFALRRGQVYGTILCDLENHRPVDLLPERSAAAFADWLREHPGAAIISRDRGGDYAKGARDGAPHAVQVADRWHLLHNLTDALERAVDARQALLAEVTRTVNAAMVPSPTPTATAGPSTSAAGSTSGELAPDPASMAAGSSPPARLSRAEQKKQASRARRLARYGQVRELHRSGMSRRKIARTLKMCRNTVDRFIACEQFPERATAARPSRPIDALVPYLKQRWQQGCDNAVQLWQEIRAQGFAGSIYGVRRLVRRWRQAAGIIRPRGSRPTTAPRIVRPSARRIAWLALGHVRELTPQDELILQAVYRCWPQLAETAELCRQFASLLKEHDAASLEAWMQLAAEPGILPEVKRFAEVLRQDWSAVVEAVRQPWSQGQTEGQINRLKLIKRQMYGRASFELLRQRVLHGLNRDGPHAQPA